MLLLILSLSGCTKVATIYKDKPILPDKSQLVHPCEAQYKFTTPRQLMIVSKRNEKCIEQYKATLDKLTQWKTEQEKIYNVNTSK